MREVRKEKVDFEILIRVDQNRVFDSIATARGLDEWFTNGTQMEEHPDGEIKFRWKDYGLKRFTGEYPGKVLEIDRPNRFVFQWMADSGSYFSTAEFNFESVDEGTIIHLIEYGYENSEDGMQDLLNRVSGWAHVLTLLKFYLEFGARG